MEALHVNQYPEMPDSEAVFLQPWWWKAVCPEGDLYALRLIGRGGPEGEPMPEAFWPLCRVRRLRLFRVLANPSLTQHCGPYLKDRKRFTELLEQLPDNASLCLNVGFELTEAERALCREQGISCTPRITQRIVDTGDIDKVFSEVKSSRQRKIKTGLKHLHRVDTATIDDLIRLQTETFARQGLKLPYKEDVLRNLYAQARRHEAGELIALADERDRLVACGFFVYDTRSAYIVASGYVKADKETGAGSLLMWEGIKTASRKGLDFDFLGSVIKGIADFNSSFGARPFTYTRLERYRGGLRILKRLNMI